MVEVEVVLVVLVVVVVGVGWRERTEAAPATWLTSQLTCPRPHLLLWVAGGAGRPGQGWGSVCVCGWGGRQCLVSTVYCREDGG